MRKSVLREKGQVSLETLVLAMIILIFSTSVLSHYTQISDTTMAMYLLDTETLKEIDRAGEVVVKEGIEYKIDGATGDLELCLFTRSTSGADLISAAAESTIETLVTDRTSFTTVNFHENNPNACN